MNRSRAEEEEEEEEEDVIVLIWYLQVFLTCADVSLNVRNLQMFKAHHYYYY